MSNSTTLKKCLVRKSEVPMDVWLDLVYRRLTPEQAASILEEWELICEERGWPGRASFPVSDK